MSNRWLRLSSQEFINFFEGVQQFYWVGMLYLRKRTYVCTKLQFFKKILAPEVKSKSSYWVHTIPKWYTFHCGILGHNKEWPQSKKRILTLKFLRVNFNTASTSDASQLLAHGK